MNRKDPQGIKSAYIKYVREWLESNPEILQTKGFDSLKSLLSSQAALKKFDENAYKNIYKALTGKSQSPDLDTLALIEKIFKIPRRYSFFVTKIQEGDQDCIKYLNYPAIEVWDISKINDEVIGESILSDINATPVDSKDGPKNISPQLDKSRQQPWKRNLLVLTFILFCFGIVGLITFFYKNRFNFGKPTVDISRYEINKVTAGFNDWPEDCRTLSIVDFKDPVERKNNCWGTQVIKVDTGTVINIVVYYHNTDSFTTKNVVARLRQFNSLEQNKTVFYIELIINKRDTVRSFAEAIYTHPKAFLFGTIKKYQDKMATGKTYDDVSIFSDHGFEIGDIPGFLGCPINDKFERDGACHEGWLMISFTVVDQ